MDDIVQSVTGTVDVAGSHQRQVLDVRAQGVAHRRHHRIGALGKILLHHIAIGIDHVDIVASITSHRVVAATTIQQVGTQATVEDIVARITHQDVLIIGAIERVTEEVAAFNEAPDCL
ncbi:hypothetical protein D3C84_784930 [compost metagenome]